MSKKLAALALAALVVCTQGAYAQGVARPEEARAAAEVKAKIEKRGRASASR